MECKVLSEIFLEVVLSFWVDKITKVCVTLVMFGRFWEDLLHRISCYCSVQTIVLCHFLTNPSTLV